MTRFEANCLTGEVSEITLTPEEEEEALQAKAAWDAENTLDKRAVRAIAGVDRLQFEMLFNHENRVRVLEGQAAVTVVQFRDALIARWKALNP